MYAGLFSLPGNMEANRRFIGRRLKNDQELCSSAMNIGMMNNKKSFFRLNNCTYICLKKELITEHVCSDLSFGVNQGLTPREGVLRRAEGDSAFSFIRCLAYNAALNVSSLWRLISCLPCLFYFVTSTWPRGRG